MHVLLDTNKGFTLITHNLKEFNRVPDLACESWVVRP